MRSTRSSVAGLVFVLAWLASSVFLATGSPARHAGFRTLAALIVGLPGAVAFAWTVRAALGGPTSKTTEKVRGLLETGLDGIYRDTSLPRADIMRVSFHVWLLPLWYRRFGSHLGKFIDIKGDESGRRKPKLVRLVAVRIRQKPPSGITFRNGEGLVGRCIALNKEDDLLVLRYTSKRVTEALQSTDEAAWRATDDDINLNLPLEHAKRLGIRYREAAAVVMQEPNGQPIGCITLELPPNRAMVRKGDKKEKELRFPKASKGILDHHENDPLVKHLLDTAQVVQSYLRLHDQGER